MARSEAVNKPKRSPQRRKDAKTREEKPFFQTTLFSFFCGLRAFAPLR
jgi:hypothetical protein